MNFEEVALECIKTPELVREFNRLAGCNLGVDNRKPVERMVDKATGYQVVVDRRGYEEMGKFVKFIFKSVWLPLMEE